MYIATPCYIRNVPGACPSIQPMGIFSTHQCCFYRRPIHYLFNFMSQASPLQAAMGGSVANSNGRLGWTISTTDVTRLIRCHGPVYGRAPTSNCAKCYANLSILRFLLQLHLYKGEPTPLFENYPNSQSLITTISHVSKWTLHFPSTTLQQEWDMLQAITTTLQKLHSRPKLIHGKSHHDPNPMSTPINLQATNMPKPNEASQPHFSFGGPPPN